MHGKARQGTARYGKVGQYKTNKSGSSLFSNISIRVTVVTCSKRVYEHCMLATSAAWVFAQHGFEPGEHVIVCREVF